MYPPPQDLQQSLQARLSADLAQQGSGAFGEPPDSSGGGGARSGGGDSGGRSGNDELTEVMRAAWFEILQQSLSPQKEKTQWGHRLHKFMAPLSCDDQFGKEHRSMSRVKRQSRPSLCCKAFGKQLPVSRPFKWCRRPMRCLTAFMNGSHASRTGC